MRPLTLRRILRYNFINRDGVLYETVSTSSGMKAILKNNYECVIFIFVIEKKAVLLEH